MTRDDAATKILLLTPQFPYPPHQGTTLRNFNLIAGLALRHEVHLISFGDPTESQGTPVDDLCQSVQVVPPPQRTMDQRLKGLAFSRLPDMAQRLPSAAFRAALVETLERLDPDVVEVEGIELAQYLFQVADLRGDKVRPLLVYDDHNAEYVLQQRAFETDVRQPRRWIAAAYSYVQWRRLRAYERRACLTADRVVAVSDTDAEALRKLVPGLELAVVPNGVDMDYYTAPVPPLAAQEGPGDLDLVFTAKMDFRPNVDAVLWFSQSVLPLVRRESPETRFWAVGKTPHARLAPLAKDPGVVLTGWVEDVRPYIAGACLYVIPLRIGGGTRLKVLEAMAMGKAIVSTALGCEGFDLVPDQELVIAGEPAEFAAAVLDLLRDAEHQERLGRAARRYAGSRYDWRMIVPRLEKVYETQHVTQHTKRSSKHMTDQEITTVPTETVPTEIEEDKHWWFAGRTWSLLNMIDRVVEPDGKKRVLDIGCGAGNMFHHLARYGPVVGVDNNPKPLVVARERGHDVRDGAAEDLPFEDESFELVSLLDTVEHCDDDLAVLRECYRVCAPGGHLVITVPAFMWLWSHNDELNAHKLRYTTKELGEKLARVGFQVERMTYNNFFVFPMAAALILLRRGAEQEPELASPHFDDESYQVEMEPAPPLLNTILSGVTWTESQVLRWLNLPVGTSIICIAQKPEALG